MRNMTIQHLAYLFLLYSLTVIYAVGLFYMLLFRIGYGRNIKLRLRLRNSPRKPKTSVVIPIYNEQVSLIKETLDSLASQKAIVNLIVVIKDPSNVQVKLLKSYSRVFHSLKIVVQEGKPSQNEALIEGLRHSKTKYTAILCSDIKIRDDSLRKMLISLETSGKDVVFGMLYPEAKNTYAGNFTSIGKIFKQNLTLRGRAATGLGWYIPGAFAVYKTELLRKELGRSLKNNFVMQDYWLTLRLLANRYDKCYFLPAVVGTELEKGTFSGWLLQYMRWFIGSIGLSREYLGFFSNAKARIKAGMLGQVILWWWFPVALFIGFFVSAISAYFNLSFFLFYALVYLVATAVLLSLPDIREYGVMNCSFYWLIKSLISSLAIVSAIYGILFEKYHTNELYKMYKR